MAAMACAFRPGALAPGLLTGAPNVMVESQPPTPTSANVEPTKLFIGGISRNTTTKHLRDHFSKGGRVLDCVAMRTPDGRSRGFGYVTLDSPAAAERFLAEPQSIDNRIVDMKRAVPEDTNVKVAPKAPGRAVEQAMYPQPGMFYPSADEYAFYAGFAGMAMPQPTFDPSLDCFNLLAGVPGAGMWGGSWPAPQMAQPLEQAVEATVSPKSMKTAADNASAAAAAATKQPLGEVTNVLSESSQLILGKKPAELSSASVLRRPSQPAFITTSIVSPSGSAAAEPCFIFEDGHEAAPEVAEESKDDDEASVVSTQPPSEHEVAELSRQVTSPEAPGSSTGDLQVTTPPAEELPSRGSADHAAGDCRRCNFFAKGRCQSGLDCTFCHFPHERRKLSRQEKREHRAAQDTRDSGSEGEEFSSDLFGPLLTPTGGAPPGLSLSAAPFVPAGPPGLPAPDMALAGPLLPMPASEACEAKVSPSCFLSTNPTLSTCPSLSTTPTGAASGASSFLLSTCPEPAAQGPPGVFKKETRTIETQTDDDFGCPHCDECVEDVIRPLRGAWRKKACECVA